MDFKSLVGETLDFYGVDNNVFCLGEDGNKIAFEAVEDESDGYRSMMEEVREVPVKGNFFKQPLCKVTIEEVDTPESKGPDWESQFNGYQLVDESGHVWLKFGTTNLDDYYPGFRFEYSPKKMVMGRSVDPKKVTFWSDRAGKLPPYKY